MKKITSLLMALIVSFGIASMFSGESYADYAGNGDYTVNVYHDSSMSSQPMGGRVDDAFVKAIVTKNGDKYNVTFKTQPIKYMGFSGAIEKMAIASQVIDYTSSPNPVPTTFQFSNLKLNESDGVLTSDSICNIRIAKYFHKKNVKCFFTLTKK